MVCLITQLTGNLMCYEKKKSWKFPVKIYIKVKTMYEKNESNIGLPKQDWAQKYPTTSYYTY